MERPANPETARAGPTIAVIVCTKGRPEHASTLVARLAKQTRPPDEIVVVDGDATDALRGTVAGVVHLTYLHRPADRGLPEARNAGVRAATADVCLFLDDDATPGDELLAQIAAAYRDPAVLGVGGVPVEARAPRRARVWFVRTFQRGPFAHPAAYMQREPGGRARATHRLSGCAMSYRRDVLVRIPFDEDLRKYALGEDMEHSWRVAMEGRLLLLPDARVAHAALGWSSGAAEQRFERKVRAYAYHYLKNLRTERRHRLAFAWLMAGIAGEALFHSAVTGTLGPWRGFRRGMRASRTSLRGDLVAQDPLGRA